MAITRKKLIISVADQFASSSSNYSSGASNNSQVVRSCLKFGWAFTRLRGAAVKSLFILLASVILSGCGLVDFKRVAYDFLRQEDCRRNDVDVYEFCSRTFVFEYDEYEQLRQEYMRSEQDKILRDQAARERYSTINEGD